MKQFDKREVIVGLLVLFIGILIGSFWLSDVAAPAQAVASTVGSIATACTLVFLVCQNREQSKRLDKQEDHQEGMWKEQHEMLIFQKLQTHKSLFNNLLSEIEKNFQVTFFDKTGLYKKIFPNNNFDQFSTKIDHQNKYSTSQLQHLKLLYTRVVSEHTEYSENASTMKLKNHEYNIPRTTIIRHFQNLDTLRDALNLTLPNKKLFGDVICSSKEIVVINIFSQDDTLRIFEQVLRELYHFAGLDCVYDGNCLGREPGLTTMLKICQHSGYRINAGKIEDCIISLCEAHSFVQELLKNRPLEYSNLYSVEFELKLLFSDGLKNLNETQAITTLYENARRLHHALESFADSDPALKVKCESTLNALGDSIEKLNNRLSVIDSLESNN